MRRSEAVTAVAALDSGVVEYRLERRGEPAVVVFHGGHMRAGLNLGEEVFAGLGLTVLAPSRPGYGRTPVDTGRSPAGFADVTAELCRHLGIEEVAAVVGISGGGPTAIELGARHPDLVRRLILESSVGLLPWPDRLTRLGAHVVFAPATEGLTWAAVRGLMRIAPATGLRLMLGSLSTRPVSEVLASLSAEHRATLVALFCRMRSGAGFRNDLRYGPGPAAGVAQPTLVIASRHDGAVPFAHAESLAAGIARAELLASEADTHFIWLAEDYPAIADRIRRFLAASTV